MRTINYSICFVVVLIPVALLYGGVLFFSQQPVQLPILIMLPFLALCVERMWALLKWMSPVIGSVDTKEQERTRTRIVEYELSRALRYGSPLVIAAIREKNRTSSHVVAKNLRNTDIVLRSPSGYLMVLMPNTKLEQANSVIKRLTTFLSIKDVVVADEVMLQAAITLHRNSNGREVKGITARAFRIICTREIGEKLASIKEPEDETSAPVIYSLYESTGNLEPLPAPAQVFTCPLPALDDPAAIKRATTRLLREAMMTESEIREA